MEKYVRATLRDAVFGLQDGLVSTLGAVTGVAAGTGDARAAAVAGLVVVAVESASMAAGSYLSAKAHREYLERLLREEERAIELDPEGERAELRRMYAERGWPPEDIAVVERRLMADKGLLLEDMAHKELGIIPGRPESELAGAAAMGAAYLIAGAPAVAPYFLLPLAAATIASFAATGAALLAVGAAKGRLVGKSPWRSGAEMLAIGAATALLGWAVGRLAAGL